MRAIRELLPSHPNATARGREVVRDILSNPHDPRVLAIARYAENSKCGVRYEANDALCNFGEVPGEAGTIAVLALVFDGHWRFDDVRFMKRSQFDAFGEQDDRTVGGVMP